jgi:hypothetical protein
MAAEDIFLGFREDDTHLETDKDGASADADMGSSHKCIARKNDLDLTIWQRIRLFPPPSRIPRQGLNWSHLVGFFR